VLDSNPETSKGSANLAMIQRAQPWTKVYLPYCLAVLEAAKAEFQSELDFYYCHHRYHRLSRIHGTMCHTPSKINIMTYYRHHTHLKGDFFWMKGKRRIQIVIIFKKKPGKSGESAMKQARNI
jgi:hypothetical protein